ncbi:dimethylaniline monooxygenase (N-oxide forming) [Saccharata proteae CBS 121410]|uniref:Dimethylaniline monooxygenase (N-oxide forming) n=1 Tax=Saccharata proteae CBS 121410 TaxID=1314787 RepID=A0A9P4I315_9PEZI|nr:dimethylaniline monooxygenase (N-oxide forming) [Saccharata proteae CBS 121410]
METLDLVVIGAGWYGLAAAKTYLQIHPEERTVILDGNASVGGVWAKERIYPGLKSNNMLGTYEYSDFPMETEAFGVKPGEHIPGEVLHRYLTSYAEYFGLHRLIQFNTRVVAVERAEDDAGWIVTSKTGDEDEKQVLAKKLIVATGLTSEPNVPELPGSEVFGAPIFHMKDFRENEETISSADNVTVIGGGKSAWDAAYAYASQGVHVDMIIRESGKGPAWMAPPYVTPFKKWLEKLVHTRFMTWFSPCVWGKEDGHSKIRRFLHKTWFGRKIVKFFWKMLGKDVLDANAYDSDPEVQKLKPWSDPFWVGSALSILNYPTNFFDLVKQGTIRVHVADIDGLSEKKVYLSNGDELDADAIVCATGWKSRPPINFLPAGIDQDLGLPHHSLESSKMILEADEAIQKQFPSLSLKHQPKNAATVNSPDIDDSIPPEQPNEPNQPFRLYRFIVPPSTFSSRTLAFAGMLTNITTAVCAQTQALWISAYFDGKLDRYPASPDDLRWQTSLHTQFGRWRSPCGYRDVPDFVFDALPYVDMLLNDLAIENKRKGGWWKERFEPYGPEDYRDVLVEWRRRYHTTHVE